MRRFVTALGASALRLVEGLGRMTVFFWAMVRALFRPPLRPRTLLREIYDVGVLSVALVCGAGFAVGMVLGLQGHHTLVRFGAEQALGTMVGLSLIRELGPVLTGLLVTGRAGSAMTAEIGAMVVTEQLDGLRMMSVDPVHYVVMPKGLAMSLAMPLLSTLFILFGVAGGYAVGVVYLGLDGGTYVSALENSVEFYDDVLQSFVKAGVFGILLGVIGSYRGFTSERNAAGVSRATTSTVVTTSVWILVSDYFITALWGV
jgi:phospholipid/cholesterol/gamma-HCH transport system permease protein